MNERDTIIKIQDAYPVSEGTTPLQCTKEQQRAFNLIGKLLLHAHRKGKRRNGRWVK